MIKGKLIHADETPIGLKVERAMFGFSPLFEKLSTFMPKRGRVTCCASD